MQEYSENFKRKMVQRMHAPLRISKPSEEKMVQALENLAVADGDPVRTGHIATALTAGSFAYDDGATQTFEPGGGTTYVEHERIPRLMFSARLPNSNSGECTPITTRPSGA